MNAPFTQVEQVIDAAAADDDLRTDPSDLGAVRSGGRRRVERDGHPTTPQGAQVCADEAHVIPGRDRDPVAGADAQPFEACGRVRRQGFELGERECRVAVDHRRGIGAGLGVAKQDGHQVHGLDCDRCGA